MNFAKSIIADIFAIFRNLAKQSIYLDSPDHVLQNDVQHVQILRVPRICNGGLYKVFTVRLMDFSSIWGKFIVISVIMFLMTSYASHQLGVDK